MSVNTAHANGGVLIHAGETILLFSDNVAMEFSGQDGAIFKGTKVGRIYLTTHRIIFNSKNNKEPMQSFSSPFISMSDVDLEQPVFGANFLKGKIRAQQNGNFTGEVKFKLLFKSGGCTDFGSALLRAASMAKRNANGMAPPPYEPPGSGWYAAPPPSYTPTPGAYGWLPQNSAFGQPPTDGVYMSDAPPPYPGINSTPQPPQAGGYPQQQQFGGAPPSYPSPPQAGGFPQQQFGGAPPYPGAAGAPSYPGAAGAPSYPGAAGASGGYPPQQQFGNATPYPGASGGVYPNLPSQPYGFNSPSAPMTKEQEAAASSAAFYDPRNPNSAYVQNPQNYEMPPSYDSLNSNNNPNKKTQ